MSSTEQKNDRRALVDRTERTREDRHRDSSHRDPSLGRIEKEIAKHSRDIRRTQRGFALFAAAALVLALANLLAVSFKLGTKDVRVAPVAAKPASAHPAAAAAPVHSLSVSLTEMKITPSATQGAAGKVTFHVRNAGSMDHEFVVLKTNEPAANIPMQGAKASEAGHVGEIGGLKAGQSKTLTLNLKPGHYSLICNLPGHYKGGMHADFTVK